MVNWNLQNENVKMFQEMLFTHPLTIGLLIGNEIHLT